LPRLHAFQVDYGTHGFQSIPINIQDNWDIIKAYARIYQSLYLKDNGVFWNTYKQGNSIPLNYVIDTAGIVRYVTEGWNEAAIRNTIEQYLPDGIEHDVGVTRLIAPTGSPDSGAVIVPSCSLYNFRSYTETYPVRMKIGATYDEVVTVTNHAPGQQVYVEFPAWTALVRGQTVVTCTTELADDDIGSNNAKSGTVAVNVYDIAVNAILAPVDTVDSGIAVVPAAVVENRGTMPDMAKVRFYIGDFYMDSVNVALQPGKTRYGGARHLDAGTGRHLPGSLYQRDHPRRHGDGQQRSPEVGRGAGQRRRGATGGQGRLRAARLRLRALPLTGHPVFAGGSDAG